MDATNRILEELKKHRYKVSTDTRTDVSGSVFFALRGDSFDGNTFIPEALRKGAVAAVADDPAYAGEKVFVVPDTIAMLQTAAKSYRASLSVPIICIGGSNGKTTSKELVARVLATKYKTHSTRDSLNNHIGVPLTILSMAGDSDIGVFEIGANHPGEHAVLLDILQPTHVVVTNNGLDHLEGFGSPDGVRKANGEIYTWAAGHVATVFVHTGYPDLMEDSRNTARVLYPSRALKITGEMPLSFEYEGRAYATNLAGAYNMENIELALAVGEHFGVDTHIALTAICEFTPLSKRSQQIDVGGIHYIVDCYNANPTSMHLALLGFVRSASAPRGVILGDMLELGEYAEEEHRKIIDYLAWQKLDAVVLVGEQFKKAMEGSDMLYQWFPDSPSAALWFSDRHFDGYTFLLKGSRGMKIEKIIGM